MSTTLKLDTLPKGKEKSHSLQYIPANIEMNGPEEVDIYFNAFTRENKEKKCLENSLRGYPFQGEVKQMVQFRQSGV